MTKKTKILELSEKGYSYSEICSELSCSKGTVSYHLGVGQKEKNRLRQLKNKKNLHPYLSKLYRFIEPTSLSEIKLLKNVKFRKILTDKIFNFHQKISKGKRMKTPIQFTIEDVINKFGENPKCYLTGESINIYKPRTYHFDHKIPRSQGGDNSINNLGICTKDANLAKRDKTPEEFLSLCKSVLEYNGYSIQQKKLESNQQDDLANA